jgi:prepilin-type N-terminal cleavage/methylation domain-containing protein
MKSAGYIKTSGFTLTEMMIVIVIMSLIALLVQNNFFGVMQRNVFIADVQDFISAFQMAANAAAQSNRKYEMIIDVAEQTYTLREITSPELDEVLEEEIVIQDNIGEYCQVLYVEFDDKDYTNEGRAKFRAGRAGWQYGGKIVLIDQEQRKYSVVINRLNPKVEFVYGDVELLEPKPKEEVSF